MGVTTCCKQILFPIQVANMMVVITEDKAKVLALDAFQSWAGFHKKISGFILNPHSYI